MRLAFTAAILALSLSACSTVDGVIHGLCPGLPVPADAPVITPPGNVPS
jgi:hypothetical protein